MKGLQELLDNLDAVGASMKASARGCTNAAAQVVKREAISIARQQGLVSTGALVNNIAVKREPQAEPGTTEYHIGVRHGREAKGAQKVAIRGADGRIRFEYTDNPFYWHMWEFGHYNVFLRRHVAAKSFMRAAMINKQGELLDVMKNYLVDRLELRVGKALS